jgi:competence protein ComGC
VGKIKKNQDGFGAIEMLLIIVIFVIIGSIAFYIYHSNKNVTKTYNSDNQTNNNSTAKLHTPDDAAYFTQDTYTDYLAAVKSAGTNSQPGLAGLAAVKNNLTSEFYSKAAASQNGEAFSCDGDLIPKSYQSTVASYTKTNATVAVAIINSKIGSNTTKVIIVNVDLTRLKITAVDCN